MGRNRQLPRWQVVISRDRGSVNAENVYGLQVSHYRHKRNNDIMTGKHLIFTLKSLSSCYYYAIMKGCSHWKHNDITSLLCVTFK